MPHDTNSGNSITSHSAPKRELSQELLDVLTERHDIDKINSLLEYFDDSGFTTSEINLFFSSLAALWKCKEGFKGSRPNIVSRNSPFNKTVDGFLDDIMAGNVDKDVITAFSWFFSFLLFMGNTYCRETSSRGKGDVYLWGERYNLMGIEALMERFTEFTTIFIKYSSLLPSIVKFRSKVLNYENPLYYLICNRSFDFHQNVEELDPKFVEILVIWCSINDSLANSLLNFTISRKERGLKEINDFYADNRHTIYTMFFNEDNHDKEKKDAHKILDELLESDMGTLSRIVNIKTSTTLPYSNVDEYIDIISVVPGIFDDTEKMVDLFLDLQDDYCITVFDISYVAKAKKNNPKIDVFYVLRRIGNINVVLGPDEYNEFIGVINDGEMDDDTIESLFSNESVFSD